MKDAKNPAQLTSLLCFGAYALNRSFGRFYQAAFAESGLTYPKYVILMALDAFGPATVSELSSRAAVEPNTLSPLLKKMASYGLITRERATEDERRVVLTITDLGREILGRAQAVAQEGFDALGLDPQAVEQAVDFMHQARAQVDSVTPPKLNLDDLL